MWALKTLCYKWKNQGELHLYEMSRKGKFIGREKITDCLGLGREEWEPLLMGTLVRANLGNENISLNCPLWNSLTCEFYGTWILNTTIIR